MNVVLFCHSLLSDWNHGNAHFLRGVVTELERRGHPVRVYEARDAWSVRNLVETRGELPLRELRQVYPELRIFRYDPGRLDLEAALDGADLVLVHEWTEPELLSAIGRMRARGGRFRLLFHDTHHRCVTDAEALARQDLSSYDGVLAFGEAVREGYLRKGWARRAWTWHEAADVRVFRPRSVPRASDLVWVGNWGDGERAAELSEFLLEPVRRLGLEASVYGVRYPADALDRLCAAGIRYGGWLPNYGVPDLFAGHRVTVHVPRWPYAGALPGIPTIRVFEALACGIPLVSAPFSDTEGLFRAGRDFLVARDGDDMVRKVGAVLREPELAAELSRNGLERILSHHTCAHRVDELLRIARGLGAGAAPGAAAASSGGRGA